MKRLGVFDAFSGIDLLNIFKFNHINFLSFIIIDCLSKNSIFYDCVHICHIYFFINAFYAIHLVL